MGSIDQIRSRLKLGPALSDEQPDISPLGPEHVRGLRLPWLSRFSLATLSAHLAENPGLSFWVPATGEYLVAEQWRHREEIANIVEVGARKGKRALAQAFLEALPSQGYSLAVLPDEVWRDDSGMYRDLGFSLLETIVFFEKDLRPKDRPAASATPHPPLPTLRYELLLLSDLDLLEELDRSSFPWLWWNSRAEFESYIQLPDVFVYAAEHEGVPVGYASYTMYPGWAHLDRLAVSTPYQGRRYGAAQLVHALQFMENRGARTVALSTQLTNVQSHHLYTGFGFRRRPDTMSFYGAEMRNG
ncbi:MAG: GNAT family N-acetyltransferase [Chloroflexia bacterium]